MTGGGPGTMEAANKGAASVDLTRSEAEAIYLPFEEAVNKYVYDYTKHDDFFSRLDTFSNCDAFIVTPRRHWHPSRNGNDLSASSGEPH